MKLLPLSSNSASVEVRRNLRLVVQVLGDRAVARWVDGDGASIAAMSVDVPRGGTPADGVERRGVRVLKVGQD